MSNEAIVTTPPDVVRTLASSTVFVKASSLVNLDFTGIAEPTARETEDQFAEGSSSRKPLDPVKKVLRCEPYAHWPCNVTQSHSYRRLW